MSLEISSVLVKFPSTKHSPWLEWPYLKTLLYGVGGFDPLTYAIGAATVILAALLASYPPTRRATRIDPATSLRAE
jgi:ABC-type antimicrobial peptide transport system permease subunit